MSKLNQFHEKYTPFQINQEENILVKAHSFFDYVRSIEAIKYTYNYLNKYVIENLEP